MAPLCFHSTILSKFRVTDETELFGPRHCHPSFSVTTGSLASNRNQNKILTWDGTRCTSFPAELARPQTWFPQLPNGPKGSKYGGRCSLPEMLWDNSSSFYETLHNFAKASCRPFHLAPDQQSVGPGGHTGVLSAQWKTESFKWLVYARHRNKQNSIRTSRAQHHDRKRNMELAKIEQGDIGGLSRLNTLGQ